MNVFSDLPVAGQYSILGLLVAVIVLVVVLFLRGDIATRKEVDAVQKVSDTFESAWGTAMAANDKQTDLIKSLTITAQLMERVLNGLPKPSDMK